MGVLVESVCGRGSPTSRAAAIGISASPSRGEGAPAGPVGAQPADGQLTAARFCPADGDCSQGVGEEAAGSQSQAERRSHGRTSPVLNARL